MFGDAFVHAFVTAADENRAILLREAASSFLIEAFTCSREKNDGRFLWRCNFCCRVADRLVEERFDCFKKRLGLEDHAFAAAERAVVDGAVAVLRELAQVLDVNLHDAGFGGAANDAVLQRTSEEFRKDSDEVEAHRREV